MCFPMVVLRRLLPGRHPFPPRLLQRRAPVHARRMSRVWHGIRKTLGGRGVACVHGRRGWLVAVGGVERTVSVESR
jgi:hypothetical protein